MSESLQDKCSHVTRVRLGWSQDEIWIQQSIIHLLTLVTTRLSILVRSSSVNITNASYTIKQSIAYTYESKLFHLRRQ